MIIIRKNFMKKIIIDYKIDLINYSYFILLKI